MINDVSLASVADSLMVTMSASVDNALHYHTSKGIYLHGRTEDRMSSVSGCESNSVSRRNWDNVFEK